MSTALATVPDDNALIAAGGLGLEDTSSIRPTPMVLKQPTTEGLEAVLPGVFVDKLSGEQWKEVKFVPLSIHAIRDKYPSATYVKGELPICRSRDGLVPVSDDKDLVPQAASCRNCPHSTWANYNNKTKTGQKPTCRESYLIMFIEQTTALPFYLKVTGLSVKTAKRLKEAITRNAQIIKARTGQMPNLFDYVVTMKSTKGEGPYYNIEFPNVNSMTKVEAEKFGPMYLELIRRKDQVEAAVVEAIEGEIVESDVESV